MNTAKIATFISAAAIGLFATTVSALALSAVATGAVNVRTGPNVSFTRVDTLFRGEAVNVTECQNGWCYIQHSGPDGWVSGNYLSVAPTPTPTPTPPPPSHTSPNSNVNFGLTIGSGGPSFSISVGGGGHRRYTPTPVSPKVCFFNGPNYTGASFCVDAGDQNNRIRGFWNDKITSIRVQPGATVTVCRNRYFGGNCRTINSNVRQLRPFMNNSITSFKTY